MPASSKPAAKSETKTTAKAARKEAAPKAAKSPAPKAAAAKPVAEKAAPPAKKPATSAKKAAKGAAGFGVSPDQRRHYIEVAAYYIAERRGFHGGSELDDWVQAEQEIDRLLRDGMIGNN